MKIENLEINKINIAEVKSEQIEINSAQDALDIFANSMYQGASKVIVQDKNIIPELFDLKTGIPGEVF